MKNKLALGYVCLSCLVLYFVSRTYSNTRCLRINTDTYLHSTLPSKQFAITIKLLLVASIVSTKLRNYAVPVSLQGLEFSKKSLHPTILSVPYEGCLAFELVVFTTFC